MIRTMITRHDSSVDRCPYACLPAFLSASDLSIFTAPGARGDGRAGAPAGPAGGRVCSGGRGGGQRRGRRRQGSSVGRGSWRSADRRRARGLRSAPCWCCRGAARGRAQGPRVRRHATSAFLFHKRFTRDPVSRKRMGPSACPWSLFSYMAGTPRPVFVRLGCPKHLTWVCRPLSCGASHCQLIPLLLRRVLMDVRLHCVHFRQNSDFGQEGISRTCASLTSDDFLILAVSR
jgi:hypothetical protein